jgi:oligosaccharide reducing-end xylanase
MTTLRRPLIVLFLFSILLSACGNPAPNKTTAETPIAQETPTGTAELAEVPTQTPAMPTTTPTRPIPVVASVKSFESGVYRNLFTEYLGKTEAEVQSKLEAAWQQLFYGADDYQRIYYPVGEDMAYVEDIGNNDVRTEGMSYGMMIAVQLDKKAEFDRIWKWTKTYMYQSDGPYKGYFAWHCSSDGKKLASNPASDGEEWFVMALFFASARWGDGEGIFNYREQAQEILHTMLHKDEENGLATNMFDTQAKQVVFVPSGSNATITDPSYHLPAYYELWSRWAGEDNDFWGEAAQVSREFFKKTANPQTGLMPDYAKFDGTAYGSGDHEYFRYDAWRTLSNVAVDYAWFGADTWEVGQTTRVLDFLASQGMDSYPNQYALEGKPLSGDHSTGLVAMAATAAMAAGPEQGKPFVQALWDIIVPSGQWRYYDGMLYMLALLHDSGNFRIYVPGSSASN